MSDQGDDGLDALRNDPADFSAAPLGDPSFTNAELAAHLDRAVELLAGLRLAPASWVRDDDVVAVLTPNPVPLETRSQAVAEELIEVIHLDDPPAWLDPQVNVRARDGVLNVEIAVEDGVAGLWAVIDVLGEAISSEFIIDPLDQQTRTARLPLDVAQGQEIRVALKPTQ